MSQPKRPPYPSSILDLLQSLPAFKEVAAAQADEVLLGEILARRDPWWVCQKLAEHLKVLANEVPTGQSAKLLKASRLVGEAFRLLDTPMKDSR